MKKRHGAEQIVAKRHQADVELGKGQMGNMRLRTLSVAHAMGGQATRRCCVGGWLAWALAASVTLRLVWPASADAVEADGGYECNVPPDRAGWTERGSGFLGDCVTVADGVMTYHGPAKAASGAAGMSPPKAPRMEEAGTIEYRLRCRAIGGNPHQWYQGFMGVSFRNERYFFGDNLGHYEFYPDQKLWGRVTRPRQSVQVKPPTSTGQWDANEWVTVRHVFRSVGAGKYRVDSRLTGPGGQVQLVDTIKQYARFSPGLHLRVSANTCKGAIFDLDYIRWSPNAVPHGTPLGPARRAPEVASIQPKGAPLAGQIQVTIKGGSFGSAPAVTFGSKAAGPVERVDAYTVRCVPPRHSETGWVDVEVGNTLGKTTVTRGFFYGRLPEITAVRPDRGGSQGGQPVTILGRGFQTGASVKFGPQEAANVRVVNSRKIRCQTPPALGGWSGTSNLTVANDDGGFCVGQGLYTYERKSRAAPKVLGWLLDVDDFNLPVAIQKLEQMPFQGVVLRPRGGLQLGPGTFTADLAKQNTDFLKATEFRRFRHNLLYACLTGFKGKTQAVGFFEDWSGVVAGYHGLGRMCRQIDSVDGIWLDVENYGGEGSPHLNSADYRRNGRSFAECERQVKLRARQIMTALLSECPDIKVMTAFGLGAGTLSSVDLLPAFVDGLLEAATSDKTYAQARVIDGYEEGYYITAPQDYQWAYDRIRSPRGIAYRRTRLPQAWAQHGAASFGTYPDMHSLAAFKTQLVSALGRTDEYVWLFTNGSFLPYNNIPFLLGAHTEQTDQYIQALVEVTGLTRATPPGRYRTIGHWRMEEGCGDLVADGSGLGFEGKLSGAGNWSKDTPTLPKIAENTSSLDIRGVAQHVKVTRFGWFSRSTDPRGFFFNRMMGASHLGNLYFTDHTIEFSFWWDGKTSAKPQYLYGADGGRSKDKSPNQFTYGGWIPAHSRKFVHWQRGNYGGGFGGIEIDLARAEAAGAYRFGHWANVAVKVQTTDSHHWRIFLNGRDVTAQPWADACEGHATVEGFQTPRDGKFRGHYFPLDLVLGARNSEQDGVADHFDGMLDEVRITAGQVPAEKLLSTP